MKRVLIVEDEKDLAELLAFNLEKEGYATTCVHDGRAGLERAVADLPDLILLDLMLPDGRGLDFLRQQRSAGDVTPVIILTAQDQISDRIAGLNAGADDYLVKPFDLFELSARVAAVARRYSGNPNPQIRLGDVQVDMSARTVQRAGTTVDLTAREWALFEAFVQRPSALLSKSQLEERLYAFGAEIESNTIEVYISRLRKKLGRDLIETVRGMGYRLAAA